MDYEMKFVVIFGLTVCMIGMVRMIGFSVIAGITYTIVKYIPQFIKKFPRTSITILPTYITLHYICKYLKKIKKNKF
jgi:hypothetical protein